MTDCTDLVDEERPLQKLTPLLAAHFCADHREDVPNDVWRSAVSATDRVLDNPHRFPKADFDYLERLATEFELFPDFVDAL